jgi:predicted dienelactone hydrolase
VAASVWNSVSDISSLLENLKHEEEESDPDDLFDTDED